MAKTQSTTLHVSKSDLSYVTLKVPQYSKHIRLGIAPESGVRYRFENISSEIFYLKDNPFPGRRMSLDDNVFRAAFEAKPGTTIRKVTAIIMDVHSATVSISMVKKEQKWMT